MIRKNGRRVIPMTCEDASSPSSLCYDTPSQRRNFGSRPSDHYFRSVCLSVCLCRVFLSRLLSDFDQTWTYAICLGL